MEESFLSKVNKTETCWLWTGLKTETGYGRLDQSRIIGKKVLRAHRVAYQLWKGEIPNGMIVRHTCDIRECVNPEHLIIGTQKDNMNDKVEHNRQLKGEQIKQSKLKEEDIINIRNSNKLHRELAEEYGVSQGHISTIRANKRWKHIL